MVRRKQQHPRPLLGLQRDAERRDSTGAVDRVHASAGTTPPPVHPADVLSEPDSVVTSVNEADADAIPLRLLGMDCKELSSVTGAQLSLSLVREGSVAIAWQIIGPHLDSIVVCSVSSTLYGSCRYLREFQA